MAKGIDKQANASVHSVASSEEVRHTPKEASFSRASRLIIVSASIVVIMAGIRAASDIVATVLLAFILAIAVTPLLDWLRRKGLPRWLAWLIIALGIIAIGLAVIGAILASASEFVNRIPAYEYALDERAASIEAWLAGFGIDFSELRPLVQANVSGLVSAGVTIVGALVSSLFNAGLVLFIAVLFLLGAPGLSSRLWEQRSRETSMLNRFVEFSRGVQQNMLGLTLNNLATSIAIMVWLFLFRIDFALLWGLMAFFLGYIPNVGMFLASLPPILLAFILYGWETAVIVTLGLIVIISVLNFITSTLIGQGVDLSPAAVFIAFIFWSWILGPLGSLLAFPLTVAMKLALDGNEETRWLGAMMSSRRFYEEDNRAR